MEKVKLTQEQAREIERIKNYFNRHEYITKFVETNGVSDSEFHIEELVRALYIGYEVEPEFKVGDYVVNGGGKVVEILEDKGDSFIVGWIANGKMFKESTFKHSILRHAIPEEVSKEKQRRWWSKHNRGLWELREGDVLKADDGGYPIEVCEVFDSRNVRLTGVIPYVKINELKEGYRVTCFAEDRKDLGDD